MSRVYTQEEIDMDVPEMDREYRDYVRRRDADLDVDWLEEAERQLQEEAWEDEPYPDDGEEGEQF